MKCDSIMACSMVAGRNSGGAATRDASLNKYLRVRDLPLNELNELNELNDTLVPPVNSGRNLYMNTLGMSCTINIGKTMAT